MDMDKSMFLHMFYFKPGMTTEEKSREIDKVSNCEGKKKCSESSEMTE